MQTSLSLSLPPSTTTTILWQIFNMAGAEREREGEGERDSAKRPVINDYRRQQNQQQRQQQQRRRQQQRQRHCCPPPPKAAQSTCSFKCNSTSRRSLVEPKVSKPNQTSRGATTTKQIKSTKRNSSTLQGISLPLLFLLLLLGSTNCASIATHKT